MTRTQLVALGALMLTVAREVNDRLSLPDASAEQAEAVVRAVERLLKRSAGQEEDRR